MSWIHIINISKKEKKDMKERMLKLSNKSLRTQAIIAAVLIAIAVAFAGKIIIGYIVGPVEFDSVREGVADDEYAELEEYDKLAGKYVTLELVYVLGEYCEKTTTTTSSSGYRSTRTSNMGYLCYDDNHGYCFGVWVSKKDIDKMEEQMDLTYDWLMGYTDVVPEPITIKGTLREMEGKELKYYKETAEEAEVLFENEAYDYYPEYTEFTIMYTIDTEQVNGQDTMRLAIALVFIIPLGIWLIVCVRKILTKGGIKKINKFLAANNISEAEVDSDFEAAKQFGSIYVGKNYTYNKEGSSWTMFKNDSIVWAYYYRVTGKNSVSRINAFTIDKKAIYLNESRNTCEEVLKYYFDNCPRMVVGYKSELEKMYKKDFQSFLALRYNNPEAQSQAAYSQSSSDTMQSEQPASSNIYKEPGNYSVKFTSVGSEKVITIKHVREINGIGLKEAKDLVESAGVIVSGVSYSSANEVKQLMESCGNSVDIFSSGVTAPVNSTAEVKTEAPQKAAESIEDTRKVCSEPGDYTVKLVSTDVFKQKETEELLVNILNMDAAKAHDAVLFAPSTIAENVSELASLEIGYQLSTVGAKTDSNRK